MKQNIKHLEQRRNDYYFRYVLPKELQIIFARREIRRKLKTEDLKIAKQLCKVYSQRLNTLCYEVRTKNMDWGEARKLLDEFFAQCDSDPYELATSLGIDAKNLPLDTIATRCNTLAIKYGKLNSAPQDIYAVNDGEEVPDCLKDKKYFVDEMIETVLQQLNITLDKNSSGYYHMRVVTAEYCKILLLELGIKFKLDIGNSEHILQGLTIKTPQRVQIPEHAPVPDNISSTAPSLPEEPPVLLGTMAEKYIKENQLLKRWADSTEKSASAAINLLVEYFTSGTDMHQMTREQLLEFREIIPRIPAYRNTRKQYKGKSIHELVVMENVHTIKLKTQQNIMVYIIAFFSWCSSPQNKNCIENIAKGLDIPDAPYSAPNKLRDNFDIDELQNMIRGLSQLNTDSKKWAWRYWIPIIGMHTGMRINEICQLYLSDIIQQDNIAFFDINPFSPHEDKRVKNKSSVRLVPIPSTILNLNFLSFVENVKAQQVEHLFPDLTYEKSQGYKRNMGRWFNQTFKKQHMSESSKKTFHSLRGNFLTQLNSSNPNHVFMQYLAGHARTDITASTYISPTCQQLKDTIELLDYGIDTYSILEKEPISDATIEEQVHQLPLQNHYTG
jgi:integrase